MKIYSKQLISEIAERTGFIKDNVEKVLRLTDILRFFNSSSDFDGKLALKGGTAINLCIANLPRLSVDIDLDFALNLAKDETANFRELFRSFFMRFVEDNDYRLSEKPRVHHALDSLLLSYNASSGNRDNIKVEINYINRAHILPLEKREIICLDGEQSEILILNPVELYASKTVALLSRSAPRDLYDVYKMIGSRIVTDIELFRKCFIFYSMVGGRQDAANYCASESE